jgi:hypothetical protein
MSTGVIKMDIIPLIQSYMVHSRKFPILIFVDPGLKMHQEHNPCCPFETRRQHLCPLVGLGRHHQRSLTSILTLSYPKNMHAWAAWFDPSVHIHPGGPETVLVKQRSSKIVIFATAKQTFLQAELCKILAQEFGNMRVSCGFWIHFVGAC